MALAVIGLILVTSYTIAGRSIGARAHAQHRATQSAMARAILEEYVVTYPAMSTSGTYKDRWRWTVSETPQPPITPTNLDSFFDLIRVTAVIEDTGRNASAYTLSTVVVRRAAK